MSDKPNGNGSAGVSLADFELENEAELNLRNKFGQPSGWVWIFAGPGHPATVAADEKQTKRYLEISDEQERARVNGRKWKGSGDTVDSLRERGVDYILRRLLRWSDDMTVGGEAFPCTPENARRVLLHPGNGIYEQVNQFLLDERSFTARSPMP
jgi:hypothetical protein